jgi:alanine dehydrogenase
VGVGVGPVFVPVEAGTRSLDTGDVIAALRRTYEAQPADLQSAGRVVVRGVTGTRVRALAAVLPDGALLGTKVHVQLTSGDSRFLIALFSQATGDLLGILDGRAITELRTGATSALAVDLMAPSGALDLAILGSGREARSHLRAIATVRPLRHVYVFSPNMDRRERFAREMSDQLGVEIVACVSAEEAVGSAATIVAAARSHGEVPIFDPAALRDVATVVSVGSTVPSQRELDERVLDGAAIIIADEPHELLEQSGDCIAAARAGIELRHKTHSLAQLVQGTLPVPINHSGVNVFKSVGSALQDVTVAGVVLESAIAAGCCLPLPIELSPKEQHA